MFTTSIQVPAELVLNSPGFFMDFGASVLKVAYVTEDDIKAAKDKQWCTVQLRSFPRSKEGQELTLALAHIRKNAALQPSQHSNPSVPGRAAVTGVGTTQFKKNITSFCEGYSLSYSEKYELDCLTKAYIYLAKHLPRSQLFQQTSRNSKSSRMDTTGLQGLFPSLMVLLGSGVGLFKIENTGYKRVDRSRTGGRTLCGLGFLLTGAKVQSTWSNVFRSMTSDLPTKYTFKDLMTLAENELTNKDDTKKSAIAILDHLVEHWVNMVHLNALLHHCQHVVFCGGLVSHPLVTARLQLHMNRTCTVPYNILANASYLGALGAMIERQVKDEDFLTISESSAVLCLKRKSVDNEHSSLKAKAASSSVCRKLMTEFSSAGSDQLYPILPEVLSSPLEEHRSMGKKVESHKGRTSMHRYTDEGEFGETVLERLLSRSKWSFSTGLLGNEHFPCLLVYIKGMQAVFVKVDQHGISELIDDDTPNTQTIFNIIDQLTGCKTEAELVERAKDGCERNVHFCLWDQRDIALINKDSADSPYSLESDCNTPLFNFGKAALAQRGDFRQKDLGRAILDVLTQHLASKVYLHAVLQDCQHILLSGDAIKHQLIRDFLAIHITKNVLRKFRDTGRRKFAQFDFIQTESELSNLIEELVNSLTQKSCSYTEGPSVAKRPRLQEEGWRVSKCQVM